MMIEPTFRIHTINAEYLHPSLIYVVRNGIEHASVFPIKKPPAGSGKDNYSCPGMAELEKLHIPVQDGAMPFVIFSQHLYPRLF
jgi:hypothetical protein